MTKPPLKTSELFLWERAPRSLALSCLANLLHMVMERSEVFTNRLLGAESASGLAFCTGERQGEQWRHNLPLHSLATCTQPVVVKLSRLMLPISAIIDDVSEVCATLVSVAVLDCPN